MRLVSASSGRRARTWVGLALIAPAALLVAFVVVLPLAASFVYSLTDLQLTRPAWKWVGLGNYQELFAGDAGAGSFVAALGITFRFALASLAIEFFLGFGLALILHRIGRFGGVVRTLLVMPIMIAPTVSALQWRWILDPDNGILNYLGVRLGLLDSPQIWLIRPQSAFWTLVLVDVWQTLPFVLLFLLAGLQSMPAEPVEAARVDGASPLQVFRYLTLPYLRPVILSVILLRFMDAFRIFDIAYVLTRGGPAFATDTVTLYTYRLGLQWFETGAASAASVVTFLIIAGCAAAFILGLQRRETGEV